MYWSWMKSGFALGFCFLITVLKDVLRGKSTLVFTGGSTALLGGNLSPLVAVFMGIVFMAAAILLPGKFR